MASWAVRYRAGEHRQVWDELRSAGALAAGDPRRADAEAVVGQTAAIIEDNLRLIERELLALGYRFLDPAPGASVAGMASAIQSSAMESLLSLPGLSEADKQQMLAQIGTVIGSIPSVVPARPSAATRRAAIGDPAIHQAALNAYRNAGGPLPMLLDSLWRRLGWVDLLGGFSAEPEGSLRPLSIAPPVAIADDYDQHLDDSGEGDLFCFDLMPDPRSASADDPLMEVPLRDGADLMLPDGGWLLDHIRQALAGGGFLNPEAAGPCKPALEAIAAACAPF